MQLGKKFVMIRNLSVNKCIVACSIGLCVTKIKQKTHL